MTSERWREGWHIFELVNGHLLRRLYIGYKRKEAEVLFRAEVKRAENTKEA